MSLILSKEAYTVDSSNLYRVSSKVNGKTTFQTYQCLQTKTDAEIETAVTNQLLTKGYISAELTPVTWE